MNLILVTPIVLSFDSWIIHFAKTKILQIQTESMDFFLPKAKIY